MSHSSQKFEALALSDLVHRRKAVGTKKKIELWIDQDPEDFCNEEQLRNYHRNMKLIDLRYTPSNIVAQVGSQFRQVPKGKRSDLLNYFIERKLNNLIQDIGEF